MRIQSITPNHHLGSGSGSSVPRFYKLEFPTYDGSVDPLGWLHRCEQFFRGQRTNEADKVWTAAYHLTNDAQFWYLQLERDFGIPTWEQFKEACHVQFGPSLHANPLGELACLSFTSSVADYTIRFLALMCRNNEPLTPSFLYTAGLPDGLHTDVELQRPSDLHTAISFAKAYEQRHCPPTTLPRQPTGPLCPSNPPTVNAATVSSPPAQLALAQPLTAPEPTLPRQVRRLTPAELAERRCQGLCFNCDETYVRGHRCARLFFIEADDYDQDSSITGSIQGSLGDN
ncbi:hypothetical protein ACQ4PT_010005 [Festuca glaucescens]